jgi:hypothetical protein
MWVAAQYGYVELVRELGKMGANVNTSDKVCGTKKVGV